MPIVTIANSGKSFACENDTIMRAAVRAGLGFPYECNIGSCGNCRFELLAGEVTHLRSDPPAWSDRDRMRNRFLGCQARPQGDCTIKVSLRDHYIGAHPPCRMRGQLVETRKITHDIREFRFRMETPNHFLAGQYALLGLPGVDGARAYSMCNRATGDGAEWHFIIRRMPDGAATGYLFDMLKIGNLIDFDGPYGMAYLREKVERDILCLAGGSGLSPMMSIAREVSMSPHLVGRKLHFIYGGRAVRDICSETMLSDLPGFNTRIFYYPAISMPEGDPESANWEGRVGFVPKIAQEMFGDQMRQMEIYFAGPPAMAEAVLRMTGEMKMPQSQVHYDQFY